MNALIDIFPVALIFFFMLNAHLCKPLNEINSDCLSLETTRYHRGFFAVAVVFHHLSQITKSGFIFPFFANVGYLCVAVFFFFSGYGLQKSYIEKSEKYKKGFLLKRIPSVLFPYVLFMIIYWVANSLSGTTYSFADIFENFKNGSLLVTYSWFMICIIAFYLFFWVFMIICKKRYSMIIICGLVWYALWILFCVFMNYGSWWYNTSHLLAAGIAWATYEDKITGFIKQRYRIIAPAALVCLVALLVFQGFISLPFISTILPEIISLIFVFCVILLSMKIRIGNRILGFLGEISLEVYLIHGLILTFSQNLIQNDLLLCAAVIAVSIPLAFVIHLVLSFALKKYKSIVDKRL